MKLYKYQKDSFSPQCYFSEGFLKAVESLNAETDKPLNNILI